MKSWVLLSGMFFKYGYGLSNETGLSFFKCHRQIIDPQINIFKQIETFWFCDMSTFHHKNGEKRFSAVLKSTMKLWSVLTGLLQAWDLWRVRWVTGGVRADGWGWRSPLQLDGRTDETTLRSQMSSREPLSFTVGSSSAFFSRLNYTFFCP